MEDDEQVKDEQESEKKEPFIVQNSDFVPDPPDESIRKTGLAWSAGIVFFGSIVFMMLLGWGADLFFGSSPWGLVGGIILGSIFGFVQFFRISSQIFGDSAAKSRSRSLFDEDEDDPQ